MKEKVAYWLVPIALLAAFVTVLSGEGPGSPLNTGCAGVGLLTDTYGATPREALEAYVRSRDGDPKFWKMDGETRFRFVDERSEPRGLATISASQDDLGVWRASGACVGNFATSPQTTTVRSPRQATTCNNLQVSIAEGRKHPPMATWEFTVRNLSDGPCRVEGYPAVDVSQNAYRLSFQFHRERGALVAASTPRSIELGPGASAYFVLEKDACDGSDALGATETAVYFGNRHRAAAPIPGRFAFCAQSYADDAIVQSPIVAALGDAYLERPGLMRCRGKDFRVDGADQNPTLWRVRLVYDGVAACELRGKLQVAFAGGTAPLVGLKYQQTNVEMPLIVPRSSTYFLVFEKPACIKPERALTSGSFQLPGVRGSVVIPTPTGFDKCDFKEAAANVVRWRLERAT